jgi:hypothetical protein
MSAKRQIAKPTIVRISGFNQWIPSSSALPVYQLQLLLDRRIKQREKFLPGTSDVQTESGKLLSLSPH